MLFENFRSQQYVFLHNDVRATLTFDILPNKTYLRFNNCLKLEYCRDTNKSYLSGAASILSDEVKAEMTNIDQLLRDNPSDPRFLQNHLLLQDLPYLRHISNYIRSSQSLSNNPFHMASLLSLLIFTSLLSFAIGTLYGVLKPVVTKFLLSGHSSCEAETGYTILYSIIETVLHILLFDFAFSLHKELFGSLSFCPMNPTQHYGRLSTISARFAGFAIAGLLALNANIFAAYELLPTPASLSCSIRNASIAFFPGGFFFALTVYFVDRLAVYALTGHPFNNRVLLPYSPHYLSNIIQIFTSTAWKSLRRALFLDDIVISIRTFLRRVVPVFFAHFTSESIQPSAFSTHRGFPPLVTNTLFILLLVCSSAIDYEIKYRFKRYIAAIGTNPRPPTSRVLPYE